jgi:hypothetical protein
MLILGISKRILSKKKLQPSIVLTMDAKVDFILLLLKNTIK